MVGSNCSNDGRGSPAVAGARAATVAARSRMPCPSDEVSSRHSADWRVGSGAPSRSDTNPNRASN